MSDNTLTHNAGQNLPFEKIALAIPPLIAFGEDPDYWQEQADAATICARDYQYSANDAFADGDFDLADIIQASADEFTVIAYEHQERADAAFLESIRSVPHTPTFNITIGGAA